MLRERLGDGVAQLYLGARCAILQLMADASPSSYGRPRWNLLAAILLFSLTVVVYLPTLKYGFVDYDDNVYVYENPAIQRLSIGNVLWLFTNPYYNTYTPLTFLSHALDIKLWGLSPSGHHLTSVLLHAANTVWLFLLFSVLGTTAMSKAAPPGRVNLAVIVGAAVAALLYAIHPMRVESVAWVSGRKDLLYAFFGIPACIAYLKYAGCPPSRTSTAWYVVALLLFTLSLLSKSMAAALALVFALFDILVLHPGVWKGRWKSRLVGKVPFLLLGATAILLAAWASSEAASNPLFLQYSIPWRVIIVLQSFAFYPLKTIWPSELTLVYAPPGPVMAIVGAFATVAISVLCVVLFTKTRALFVGWFAYVLMVAPTIAGLTAGIQAWADRYSYVPLMALFGLLTAAIVRGNEALWNTRFRRPVILLAACGAVGICAVLWSLTGRQMAIWKDSITLWTYAARIAPQLPWTHMSLGVAYFRQGEIETAISLYRQAISMNPEYGEALYNLGVAMEVQGRRAEARQLYARATQVLPRFVNAHVNLGNILVSDGKLDEAIQAYRRSMDIAPSDPDPQFNMGVVFAMKGDTVRAMEQFKRAVDLSPWYHRAWFALGELEWGSGRKDDAIQSMVQAAREGSSVAQAWLRERQLVW